MLIIHSLHWFFVQILPTIHCFKVSFLAQVFFFNTVHAANVSFQCQRRQWRADKCAPTKTRRQLRVDNCALTGARTLGYGMEHRRFITALLPTYGNSNGNVALPAEMLQTLVARLLVLQDESAPLGLQIN